MSQHECTKEGSIAKHDEAIETLKSNLKDVTVELDTFKTGLIENTTTLKNIESFITKYDKELPETKKNIQKTVFQVIVWVIGLVTLLGGFMAYQNSVIVKLQDENKQLIMEAIKSEQN